MLLHPQVMVEIIPVLQVQVRLQIPTRLEEREALTGMKALAVTWLENPGRVLELGQALEPEELGLPGEEPQQVVLQLPELQLEAWQ